MKGYKIHKKSRSVRFLTFCATTVLIAAFLYGAYVFGEFAMAMYVVLSEVL